MIAQDEKKNDREEIRSYRSSIAIVAEEPRVGRLSTASSQPMSMTDEKNLRRSVIGATALFSLSLVRFPDRYNRYTKRRSTFPKEQESRSETFSERLKLQSAPVALSTRYQTGRGAAMQPCYYSQQKATGKSDSALRAISASINFITFNVLHVFYAKKKIKLSDFEACSMKRVALF